MSPELILRRIRQWPPWTIIPIALGLALLAIVLGLVLEPLGYALNPVQVEPTPTLPAIAYSHGLSESCEGCHFSLTALQASATEPSTAQHYLIEPESVATPHGQLGCLACHGGKGEADAKEEAHQGLVPNMTAQDPEKCIICHRDLPNEIPGDRLRTPHGVIIDGILQGNPCDVHCSNCHGGVGHGFDPVSGETFCSMTVCVDCHAEQELKIQLSGCDACHLGPHDVPTALACKDCHLSTQAWNQVNSAIHPVSLRGRHGERACFDCHQYPNFSGLNNVCSDCHLSGHTDWDDHDCAECHDAGGTWNLVTGTAWDQHAELWDQYKGAHLKVACNGCHFETYSGLDPNCDTCHAAPKSHDGGLSSMPCVNCHQADRPWKE